MNSITTLLGSALGRAGVAAYMGVNQNTAMVFNAVDLAIGTIASTILMTKAKNNFAQGQVILLAGLMGRIIGLASAAVITTQYMGSIAPNAAIAMNVAGLAIGLLFQVNHPGPTIC